MYEPKLEFPEELRGGGGGLKKKTRCGGNLDIFWNKTMLTVTM